MALEVIAGKVEFDISGTSYLMAGDFTYNLGAPKREMVVGPDKVHGVKETIQIPFIEGDIRLTAVINKAMLVALSNTDLHLTLGEGSATQVFTLQNAWFAGEGTMSTGDGTMKCRFEGENAFMS